jgi:hypothetical protein
MTILHHFGFVLLANQEEPGVAAFCDDRLDKTTPPQLAFLDINELCNTVPFTIPKQTEDKVDQLAPGTTFPPPRSKTKVVSNFLLVLPPRVPFFLCNEGLAMPAKDAALSLIRLASALSNSTAQAIVTNFAWGLVTRRTLKATHPALAITIKSPRMNKELAQWRNQRLMGIFESVNLSSDTDQPREGAPPLPPRNLPRLESRC